MPRIKVLQHAQEADIQDDRKDLLHIADLIPGWPKTHYILRSEAKVALQTARALALLAALVLMRDWDRVFVITGHKVFMRFPSSDLLAGGRQDVAEILDYLEDFNRWRDARLELVVRAATLEGGSPLSDSDDAAVEAARATLAEFRARQAPDGESLDTLFRLWVGACARVQGFSLMAGSLEGRQVRSHVPAKVQILTSLPKALIGPVVEDRRHDVVACTYYFLIQTPMGECYLIRCREGSEPIREGAVLTFPEHAKSPLRRWQLVS